MMESKKLNNKKSWKTWVHILAVPWCCILPVGVALLGLTGGALGTFLSNFTVYFLTISIILIGYANYNVWLGSFKTLKHRIYVSFITLLSILLWLWSFDRMGWI